MKRIAIRVTAVTGLALGAGLALLMLAGPMPPVAETVGDPPGTSAPAPLATPAGDSPATHKTADPQAPPAAIGADAPAGNGPRTGGTLGSMSAGELAEFYRFQRLGQTNRWLDVNSRTLAVLEELAQDRPLAEIEQAAEHIREAAATHLPSHAADQFRDLVLEYVDYSRRLAALDEERNRLGLTPGDVDVKGSLTALQDRVFGATDAEGLFRQRRAAMDLMEKHRDRYAGNDEPPTEKDIREMQQEYRTLEENML